ncbi:hypothetical protein Tco_0037285, partial [Tanacetum coccineum]
TEDDRVLVDDRVGLGGFSGFWACCGLDSLLLIDGLKGAAGGLLFDFSRLGQGVSVTFAAGKEFGRAEVLSLTKHPTDDVDSS